MKDIDVQQEKCNCCQKPIREIRKLQQCEFCASFGCSDCIYKQFPFPHINKNAKDAEEQEFGLICLLCETKLHINLVTSDICYKMLKVESRIRRRDREINQIMKIKEENETRVNEQKA